MEQGDARRHKRHILDDRENESRRVGLLRGAAADVQLWTNTPWILYTPGPGHYKIDEKINCVLRASHATNTTDGGIYIYTDPIFSLSLCHVRRRYNGAQTYTSPFDKMQIPMSYRIKNLFSKDDHEKWSERR